MTDSGFKNEETLEEVDDDKLGHALWKLHLDLRNGHTVDATAPLHPIMDRIPLEHHISEEFVTLIAIAFQTRQFDVISAGIMSRFPGICSVEIAECRELPLPYLVRISRFDRVRLRLEFSPALSGYNEVRVQVLFLVWFLPLLERCLSLKTYNVGSVVLNQWDGGVVPGLAYCSNSYNHLLIPDNVFVPSQAYKAYKCALETAKISWNNKCPICFWRGSTTGQRPSPSWESLPRVQLVRHTEQFGSRYNVGLSSVVQIRDSEELEAIKASGLMKEVVDPVAYQHYKYVIDIDGNTNAWAGLFQKLLSGSVVLKIASPKGYRQWYYSRLEPWVNYVPVDCSFGDLDQKVRWLANNDDVAERIALAGRELAWSLSYDSEMDRGARTIDLALRVFS
ncbi:MAG: hypothetical protein JO264_15555 [Acidisphaera sp.]|nr:hypothetical protein [Acidisphaera sp.]